MYENIGKIIKRIAFVGCLVVSLFCVVFGFVMISTPYGYFLLIGGPLASWLLSVFLYGFGELIEKVSYIARLMEIKHDDRGF